MRSLGIALVGVALVFCVTLPLLAVPLQRWQRLSAPGGSRPVEATRTPRLAATPSPPLLFRENVFSFSYPADWWVMGSEEVSVLLKTTLKGMAPGQYSYIGGVFSEGLDNCKACAQITLVVAMDPALTGTPSDEQYQTILAASERATGARLLSRVRTEVAGMPAVESTYLGLSGDSKLWAYVIVPPQPGVAYLVSFSSHKDSFAEFEPVFRQAINTLRIGEALPTPVPTLTLRSIRRGTPLGPATPVPRTYTVQPGDVLGVIAKTLGVSLEALAEANGLEDPYIIQPGQVLTVPVGAR